MRSTLLLPFALSAVVEGALANVFPHGDFETLDNNGTPALVTYVERGGKALFLPQRRANGGLSVTLEEVPAFCGSLRVPEWPECRGLSASDLRWRTDHPAWLVKHGGELGAGGLLSRLRVGHGVAIFCQIDPGRFDCEKETFFRYTRWRQTRALAQVLANLGASFIMDRRVFHPSELADDRIPLAGPWRAKLTTKLSPSPTIDRPHPDPGITDEAKRLTGTSAGASWAELHLPGFWEALDRGWPDVDGEAVFTRTIDVPKKWIGKPLTLSLGPIDDFDDTFFNGVLVGRTDKTTPNFYSVPRVYTVPAKLVKPGPNTIAVRVFDHFGSGGFGGSREQMYVKPVDDKPEPSFYHRDYRDDWAYGDDPYRYCRW